MTLQELEDQWQKPLTLAESRTYRASSSPPVWYNEQDAGESSDAWRLRLQRQRLWHHMTSPTERGFWHACRMAIADKQTLHAWLDPHQTTKREILRFHDGLCRVCVAHLRCALVIDDAYWPSGEVLEAELQPIAEDTALPLGFLRDLVWELYPEELRPEASRSPYRPAVHEQVVTGLLVDVRATQGVVADLRLEWMPDGRDRALYPAPALAFVERDAKFVEAESNARACLLQLWPADRDVRWSIWRRDGRPLPAHLGGNSLGGAFAFGLAKLVAGEAGQAEASDVRSGQRGGLMEQLDALSTLDCSGVAITAAIVDTEGTFQEVGEVFAKLLAAAREKSLPRLHTVIVAADQDVTALGLAQDPQNWRLYKDPHADFHLIRAGGLAEAVRLLDVDRQTRWGGIDCPLPPRDPAFVGRARLTAAVRDFITTHDSGYLVLIGGVGKGKSTWLAELIHDDIDRGHDPVYHIIDYHPSGTGEAHSIARCLYDRLRRKYVFQEPAAWDEQHLSAEIKLERLLRYLSDTELRNGQKEVLYIDAADQAMPTAQHPLLPGTLRTLPRGQFCVITSRTHLDWLRTTQDVTVWPVDDYVDDRADIQVYLQQQTQRLSLPLTEDFIAAIVTHHDPPVFFTVARCVRQLQDPTVCEAERMALCTDLVPWVMPAEARIHTEALRRIAEAEALGFEEADVWETLGVLAVAAEPVSTAHLRALGLWQRGKTDRILKLMANFFRPRPLLRQPDVPYIFDHPGYYREVMQHLDQQEIAFLHRQLAHGCAACWQHGPPAVCDYALRHRLAHCIAAQDWQDVVCGFAEANYIIERSKRFGFAAVYADALAAAQASTLPHRWREAFGAWERFLRWRIQRLRSIPEVVYLQEAYNEFVPIAPQPFATILVPQCENALQTSTLFLRKAFGPPTLSGAGHIACVYSVAFAPNGKWIASGGQDGVKVWETETGRLVADCVGHTRWVWSVAFAPNSQWVASGSLDKTVKVWEASTGRLVADCRGHKETVWRVSFAPNGKWIASGGRDGVKVWEIETGHLVADCMGHDSYVRSVAFAPNSQWVVSGDRDRVTVWEAGTGRLVTDCVGHHGRVSSVAFAPDSQWVASGSDDTTVKVWEVGTGRLVADCRGDAYREDVLSTEDWRNAISLQDAMSVVGWRNPFSPDGQWIALGTGNAVTVWEAGTGRLVTDCVGHHGRVSSVAFAPDSQWVASGSDDTTVKVWEAGTWRLVADCRGHTKWVLSVVFSPDGRWVASGSLDTTVKVWEVGTGRLVADCQGHKGPVRSVVFSPDGRWVASGSDDKTMKVWEAGTGRLVADLKHRSWVLRVTFAPDGKWVAAGGADGTVSIWELGTGRLVAVPIACAGLVADIVFSSDGLWMASGGGWPAGDVCVWETATWRLLNRLYFERAVKILTIQSPCLIVVDQCGQVFGYQVVTNGASVRG